MVIIFLILTIALAITIDYLFIKKKANVPSTSDINIVSPLVFSKRDKLFPEGFLYSKGHTWARTIDESRVKIGIDDFVIKALGKVKLDSIVKTGTSIRKGDVIFSAHYENSSINFRSPIEGIVNQVNADVIGRTIRDPYEKDWGVVIRPSNLQENLTALISGKEVMHWMKGEFKRLKNLLADNSYTPELVGVTMYDGGNIVEGAVSYIKEDGLKDFEEQFLKF
ncbi:MAG: hypothetical protein NTV87_07170 [Ignavibacteriae bacterium]|jgi:glycine cleavage system H protein|nr:hypothetical protein [Ignavibacteriota bacterium]